MEESLAYFRDAIQHPETALPWDEWWQANAESVRRCFDKADYLKLKFRRLDAAWEILERLGDPVVSVPQRTSALSAETMAAIEAVAYAHRSPARVAAVAALDSAEALQQLAYLYNWDDGFEIPTAIALHPKCDLGVALDLFWLATAMEWYTGAIGPDHYDRDWIAFSRLITEGILSGRYRKGATSFNCPVTPHVYRLRKQGVPEILFSSVRGEIVPPFG
jgi:hypothetical protein